MHYRSLFHALGSLLALLGVMMLLPLAVAIAQHDDRPNEQFEALAFFVASGAALLIGLAVRTVCAREGSHIGNREGAAIVSMTWLLFSLFGCLPFYISGNAGFADAFFETMSGFTTTGATIFAEVSDLPSGLQLWRHQAQWMGGMGIIVLSVAILPILGVGGYRMFKAEAPGGSTFERNAPRIKETAKVLWGLYLGLSLLEWTLLRLGGMSSFDALCHSFTTMSTGGFSTQQASIAAWPSAFLQWTITAFMLIAGCNFAIYQQLLSGSRRRALKNAELRAYLTLIAAALTVHVIVLSLRSMPGLGDATYRLRSAAFTVASISTTTGYGVEDFNRWPDVLRLTLLLLMFVGGCAGSTAGGMKVIRLLIFIRASVNELRRSIAPRAVLLVRIGPRALDQRTVANVMGFLALWIGVFALATYLLTALGLDLLSATSAAAANLGNVGPGLGAVGPSSHYGTLPTAAKWLLALCMLLGRLELYSTLSIVLPEAWRR